MGHFSDLSIEKEEDAQKIDAENVLIVRSTVFFCWRYSNYQ